ncbi:MAG: YfiR family protein [Nibricoccus sp.]
MAQLSWVRRIIVGLFVVIIWDISNSNAYAAYPSEYELKAIFVLNFARFNTWPQSVLPSDNTPLIVGVLGADPFGDALTSAFQGEQVAGHTLEIRHFTRRDNYKNCHLLFISRSEAAHLSQIFSALSGSHVLTVSDIDQFVYKDGMIGMLMEQNRVKVEVNYEQTRREGLELSAKLLKVSFVLRKGLHSMISTFTQAFWRGERLPTVACTIK